MADRRNKDKHARTAAIVGGGALLLWLLLRGKGFGLGHGGAAIGDGAASTRRCRIRIDVDGIQTDGVATDIATMTERCQTAGSADVRATGAAITGVVGQVIRALQDAGVTVWAEPSLRKTVPYAYPPRSR